ncbi:MAG: DUF4012 domain-containing protein [Chloroflexi bacterium]|nr:DUF4012 domain-containing protein [Chloroflexota bacterium]
MLISFHRYPIRTTLIVIILVLLYVSAWSALRINKGMHQARSAETTIQNLRALWQDIDSGSVENLDLGRQHLSTLSNELLGAKRTLSPFIRVAPLVTWLPGIGGDLKASITMLHLGTDIVQTSQDLLARFDNVVDSGSRSSVASLLRDRHINEDVLLALTNETPSLRKALQTLDAAAKIQDRLSHSDLGSGAQKRVALSEEVTKHLQTLVRMSLAAAESWQSFLGFSTPRTYLIVAHNSDELRATGGFIPGAWIVTFDQGVMTELTFWDTLDVDAITTAPPLPPQGLLETIWAGAWLFRDASWFPDFPETARAMERYFQMDRPREFAGVIGLNQWGVQEILRALGPITLPSGQVMTQETFVTLMEDGTDAEGRAFMDTILQASLNRLQEEPSPFLLASLFLGLNRSLEQKHLLLAFHEPALRAMAERNRWNGDLRDVEGDYLMAVDSNVGFNKVNRNITRSLKYDLALTPTGGEARLEIVYTNKSRISGSSGCAVQSGPVPVESYAILKNACYWNFLRVYVPIGSSLAGASPFPMPQGALYRRVGYNDIEETSRTYQENDKQVYAGFFTVPEGQTRSVAFHYSIPKSAMLVQGNLLTYRLTIQKQPGLQAEPVTIAVSLPDGYRLRSSSATPISQEDRTLLYSFSLDTDKELTVVLQRG